MVVVVTAVTVTKVGGVLVVDVDALGRARAAAGRNGGVDRRYVELLDAAERLEAAYRSLGAVSALVSQPVSTVDRTRKPLGTSEVARLVGLSPQAVRKAARSGRLSGTLAADGWRFSREDVDAWNARRTTR